MVLMATPNGLVKGFDRTKYMSYNIRRRRFVPSSLRRAREMLGLTQHELAKLSRVAQSYISRHENGVRSLQSAMRLRIMQIVENF